MTLSTGAIFPEAFSSHFCLRWRLGTGFGICRFTFDSVRVYLLFREKKQKNIFLDIPLKLFGTFPLMFSADLSVLMLILESFVYFWLAILTQKFREKSRHDGVFKSLFMAPIVGYFSVFSPNITFLGHWKSFSQQTRRQNLGRVF